jgi:hypothetical protein
LFEGKSVTGMVINKAPGQAAQAVLMTFVE